MRLGIGENEWRGWMLDKEASDISVEIDDADGLRVQAAFVEFEWAMSRVQELMEEQHPEFPNGRPTP